MAPSLWARRKNQIPALELPPLGQEACPAGPPGGVPPVRFSDLFSLGKVLGSGSMATVYRVTRTSDGCEFAGKRVSSVDEEVKEFTLTEFKLMQQLDHPHVLKAYGLYEDLRYMWICTELCEDGCLQSYVEKMERLSESHALVLSAQLLQGIDFLHSKRVVHRDVKPQNLFLTGGGKQLKIGDLNSAKQLSCNGKKEAMLSQRCTMLYCAPEIRLGLIWNERVDIWGAGLCMYYMLKGALPFARDCLDLVDPAEPSKLLPITWGDTSETVAGLVEKCLTLDHRFRPAAMELLEHQALNREEDPARHRAHTMGLARRGAAHQRSRTCHPQ